MEKSIHKNIKFPANTGSTICLEANATYWFGNWHQNNIGFWYPSLWWEDSKEILESFKAWLCARNQPEYSDLCYVWNSKCISSHHITQQTHSCFIFKWELHLFILIAQCKVHYKFPKYIINRKLQIENYTLPTVICLMHLLVYFRHLSSYDLVYFNLSLYSALFYNQNSAKGCAANL